MYSSQLVNPADYAGQQLLSSQIVGYQPQIIGYQAVAPPTYGYPTTGMGAYQYGQQGQSG